MTIKEIAKKAKVSVSTVSRVLNKKDDVSPKTRKRIENIIEKYNYQPNMYAKSISNRRSQHIGVVVTHDLDFIFKNQYYDELLRGVMKATKEKGYYVILIFCEDLQEAVDIAAEKRVDGMVLLSPSYEHKKSLEDLVKMKFPIVTIGKAEFVENLYQVCTDNYYGSVLATKHLLELGHRKIGFINGPAFLPSSAQRYKAFIDTMEEAGIKKSQLVVREGGNSIETGYDIGVELLKSHPELTALFVASDHMSIGTINAVKDSGKIIPRDISLISFDGTPIAEQFSPSITTMDQFIEKKGLLGIDILIDLIDGNKNKWDYITNVDVVLRDRETTKKLGK